MLIRSALALLLAASTSMAAPPTDEQVDDLIKTITANRTKLMEVGTKMREAQAAAKEDPTQSAKSDNKAVKDLEEQRKEINEANKKAIESCPLDEATLPQIDKIVTARINTPEMNKAFAKPLAEMCKAQTVDGARACELRVSTYPSASMAGAKTPEEIKEKRLAHERELAPVYAAALKHPALPELIKSGKGDGLISRFGTLAPETVKEADLVPLFAPMITDNLPITVVNTLGGAIGNVRDGSTSGEREVVLDKIAMCAERAAERAPADTPAATIKRAKDTAKLARSGWARGTMIGNTAPDMTFQWTNGASFNKLSDLKGKVVVVDFWATWCGPCIATFPKIRELQAHYKDYPVVILGVTSIQGRHYDQSVKPAKLTDCKDDPAKELGLMPEFIKSMDMTWSVAFCDDGCFNPNYGVRGIPHLAIIAPDGKVRFNGLHPKDPADEKIDALLKEFKLDCPKEPMPKAAPKAAAGS